MVENNVESVRENDRYLEAIINRKKRTIPIASIEYVGCVRVHQSFMVRMADISKISRTSIKCGKIEVPVSRRYYGELRKMVME